MGANPNLAGTLAYAPPPPTHPHARESHCGRGVQSLPRRCGAHHESCGMPLGDALALSAASLIKPSGTLIQVVHTHTHPHTHTHTHTHMHRASKHSDTSWSFAGSTNTCHVLQSCQPKLKKQILTGCGGRPCRIYLVQPYKDSKRFFEKQSAVFTGDAHLGDPLLTHRKGFGPSALALLRLAKAEQARLRKTQLLQSPVCAVSIRSGIPCKRRRGMLEREAC